ncbi:MAG TPA: ribonuclease E/G [Lentisphaeria bacterium]|nr:MAG: hypothetical protein A2X47_08290 [Lentisphaerae bacterium GWF2_38_69]HBM15843.1 ribonuclease E/G [Lentisphaeria bacterium]
MSERKIIINSEKLETRVALLNDGKLEDYQVERKNKVNVLDSIFLGKVVNIQQSLEAVFIDIGMDKNAFMHFSDMIPATYDQANLRESEQNNPRKFVKLEDIPSKFPIGSTLFVQVTKGSIGTKGPRVTSNIAMPGRFLVLLPFSDHIGISRKIEDRKERERLKKLILKLPIPKGMGLICRTNAEDKKGIFFKREFNMLLEKWNTAENARKESQRPRMLYQEPSLLEKSIRDFLTEDICEVVVDDHNEFNQLKDFINKAAGKGLSSKIRLHSKAMPIFEYYKVEEQLAKILERKVSLPSGGYICIDETEALIAIDVNTGSSHGSRNNAEIILDTNLEAADEIARQLRLRNIGGQVVIDFIDMSSPFHNDVVLKRMRKNLKNDKAKTHVLPISLFGLMQMTRQREQQSLLDRVYDPCPYCRGTGKVKSPLSTSVEIQRHLKEILKRKSYDKNLSVRVVMNPTVLARLKNEDNCFLMELEDRYGKALSFRAEPSLHIEEFKIVDPSNGESFF